MLLISPTPPSLLPNADSMRQFTVTVLLIPALHANQTRLAHLQLLDIFPFLPDSCLLPKAGLFATLPASLQSVAWVSLSLEYYGTLFLSATPTSEPLADTLLQPTV